MAPHTNDELGRAAYDVYAQFVKNKSVHGEDLLPWRHLPTHVALAWMTAAVTVKGIVTLEERATARESEINE